MQETNDGQPKTPSLAKLLKFGVDPNALSFEDAGQRRTLLCLAVEEAGKLKTDDVRKVELLLNARADPNRRSETGDFPLLLAATHSHLKIARRLIQEKADTNQHDAKLVTPLHLAAHNSDSRVVTLLLMHKANVNAADKVGQPPIFFAGSWDVMKCLCEAQADVLHLNKKGQSALHLAAHNGQLEAVKFLAEHEQMYHMIDLQDERGRSPLHHAAARGHHCIVSRLMDVGADPRLKTKMGQTPMTLADAKDTDLAYYIYTRMTGSNKSTWGEMCQNPMFLTMVAILGCATFVNRSVVWSVFKDLFTVWLR